MVGYSGTLLATKLGIAEGSLLALVRAPAGWRLELPPAVTVRRQARGQADVVVAFFIRTTALERRADTLASMIFPSGGLWIAWPKRASGMATDITDDAVRSAALRLVWRRENRRREPGNPRSTATGPT
jgi:hypothetical protein